jgi:hypothetical protein
MHHFVIWWGGLLHLEDGAPAIAFEANEGIGIAPRALAAEYRNAVDSFFAAYAEYDENNPAARRFMARFRSCFSLRQAQYGPEWSDVRCSLEGARHVYSRDSVCTVEALGQTTATEVGKCH